MTEVERINALAALIREVDGKHEMGAGALAEALVAKGVRLDEEYTDHYQDGFNDGIGWDR